MRKVLKHKILIIKHIIFGGGHFAKKKSSKMFANQYYFIYFCPRIIPSFDKSLVFYNPLRTFEDKMFLPSEFMRGVK